MSSADLSFCAALIVFTVLTIVSVTDPNVQTSLATIKSSAATPQPRARDRIQVFADPRLQGLRLISPLAWGLYPILLLLTYGTSLTQPSPSSALSPSLICPNPSNLNPTLFYWNPYTVACLLLGCLGGLLRIKAYRDLGADFTFMIRRPSGLVSTGLYAYVQHPSYTAEALVVAANVLLVVRWDGAPGCWMPTAVREALAGWGPVVIGLVVVVCAILASIRVRDEERLLKREFGAEWEKWRAQRKRFVPGLL